MPKPQAEAIALGRELRPALSHAPRRGAAGNVLGRGPGASFEFHDRRLYAAGDDVRHLDWRAFARTDQLMVRLHREEVAPEFELIVDASRSVAVAAERAQRVIDLIALLDAAGRAAGHRTRILRLGARPEPLDQARFLADGTECDERVPLGAALEALGPLLRPDSIRVLVSDLMTPADPHAALRQLAARAGGLAVVQVLAPSELAPEVGEAVRFVDAETDAALDLVLDRRTVEAYLTRLARHEAAWRDAVQRRGGVFVRVDTGASLAELAHGPLLRSGVLTV